MSITYCTQGYSVLHVAAMKGEPQIIVSLLTNGLFWMVEKQFMFKSINKSTEEGEVSSKDR
uniref:Uncharacterized protein n=1 Tax=Lotus japonicus TaxID=34305 RepID=I3S3F2_LOTJA|nr:unknown [Lotus japonicus]